MHKYPFVVTVYRKPGSNRPVVQQHNYEDIGVAHLQMGEMSGQRDVVKVQLSVVLKEVTFWHRQSTP